MYKRQDNEAPYGRVSVCAETAATTNDSWGYKRGDKNFKTPKMIIELLCAVASKGANLLLNIGPKPNGEIPCEAVDILKSLGNWMQINSDAIYATEASPFISDFSFGWVTQKDKNLFLFLKDPVRKITIYGLENEVLSADSMAGDKVETNAACGELSLSLSNVRFADDVTVIKLVLDGKPNVKNILFQQEQNYIMLPCCACQIKKNSGKEVEAPLFESAMDRVLGEYWGNLNREMKVNINGSVEWWKSEKDSVFWEFETREPGEYEVILYTATNKYQPWVGGHRVRVLCGNNEIAATLSADILPRGVNREYFSETGSILGRVRIAQKGKCSIELRADAINLNDPAGLYVTQMVLRRA